MADVDETDRRLAEGIQPEPDQVTQPWFTSSEIRLPESESQPHHFNQDSPLRWLHFLPEKKQTGLKHCKLALISGSQFLGLSGHVCAA